MTNSRIQLPTLHSDQVRAFWTRSDPRAAQAEHPQREAWARNAGRGRMALRCGRRWGKTKYGGVRAVDPAIKGQSVGWFRP